MFIQVRRKREVPYYFEAVVSACALTHLEKYSEDLSVTAPVSLIIRVLKLIEIARLILNNDSDFIRAGIGDVICDLPSTACTDIFARSDIRRQ